MAITRPDEYKHNNSDLAIADSDNVRGGRRSVADRAALYALVTKADQLKENVTIVRILTDGDSGGDTTEVLLVDDSHIDNAAGWQPYSIGGGGSGGGGASLSNFISFDVTQDGEQPFQLPAAATGIAQVQVQTPIPEPNGAPPIYGEGDGVDAKYTSFDTATRILMVLVGAGLKAGQVLTVRYLYGGTGGGTGGPIEFSDIGGVADPSQLPVADAAYIQQLFDALKPLMDQRYTQI